MAGTTIAYSEITILDLIDTATYIYYADDENGGGVSNSPTGKTYIGIYSGEPDESFNPQNKNWTNIVPDGVIWSKYIGPTGRGIKQTYYKYATSENGEIAPDNWIDDMPNPGEYLGSYLWTKTILEYDDDTFTESVSVSYLGKNANAYYIETNQEEILKFVEKDGIVVTPETLQFKVYELPIETNQQALENFYYDLILCPGGQNSNLQSISLKADENGSIYVSKGRVDPNDDSKNIDNDTVFFYIQNCINLIDTSSKIKTILESANCFIKFVILDSDEEDATELAIKIIEYRNGLSSEMAQFNLNATGINAAIQHTKLNFSEAGLQILNGGFEILNNKGDSVLHANTDGDLIITGELQGATGTFSGILEASELKGATGDFSGTITATGGTIGGFIIDEEKIKAQSGNLTLYGNDGLLVTKNIELEGGKVTGSIQLGNAFLYNPDNYDRKILEAGAVSLKDTGALNLGNIEYIPANNVSTDVLQQHEGKWQIKGSGQAIFNEVIADSVIQKNSVLAVGTIQSVGSLMLFKDSWMVDEQEGAVIKISKTDLGESIPLAAGDWICCGKDNYKVSEVDFTTNPTHFIITLTITPGNLAKKPVAKLGNPGGDFVLSALGESETTNHYDCAQGNSITLASFEEKSDKLAFTKRLVLGQLDGVDDGASGIGLYCDNVFLKGSLTTFSAENKYAGINTTSNAVFQSATLTNSYIEDNSHIIFWAGASQNTKEAIQSSPFQVTEAGTIYAQSAFLTDSIFIEGTIRGADIYAARLHGSESNNKLPALSIYDTGRGAGISFRTGHGTAAESETFSINSTGFIKDKNNFIDLSTNEVVFWGGSFRVKSSQSTFVLANENEKFVALAENGLYFQSFGEGKLQSLSGISISEKQISIGFIEQQDLAEIVSFEKDKTEIKTYLQANKNVQFGVTTYLQYQQVGGKGYDLYVYG